LKQRIEARTANCYLCRCRHMSLAQLTYQIVHGPGRVLWSEVKDGVSLLCDFHQHEKERRRDEREYRLHAMGYAVRFAEIMPGQPYSPGVVFPSTPETESRYEMFYGPDALKEG
jgi:hypothetical protein